jgi:hypothetical protein
MILNLGLNIRKNLNRKKGRPKAPALFGTPFVVILFQYTEKRYKLQIFFV